MKIGKSFLVEAIKNSIMENGGGKENAEKISEAVLKRLDEIGYRAAALTKGANYNATQQYDNDISVDKNMKKMDRSKNLNLPALNQAINGNFKNLEFHFIIRPKTETDNYPIIFYFKEIKYIDNTKIVIAGVFYRQINNKSFNGSVEYNFDKGTFYQVNFYGGGSIRRVYPMTLNIKIPEYKKVAYDFLNFVSKYLYSVEDYQTNVNNTNYSNS